MKSAVIAALLTTVPTLAAASPFALTYEHFEHAVQHIDLDICPVELNTPSVFCRATINHDEIHVFAFSEDGDSPMVGFQSFDADALETLLK